ncbi:MAG TPA: CoA protein activase [Bacillota bacterium]|nr:CoA protein activase [Bacillota bacterium]
MSHYRVSFPHMGLASAAVETLFNELGFDVVPPPPLSRQTLILGAQHSPEFACLPLKANLGSFLEMNPGDVDLIFMAGGIGPCRFGLYGEVQREILRHLGYDIPFIILEPPEKELSEVLSTFTRYLGPRFWLNLPRAVTIAWHKMNAMDQVERKALDLLPKLPAKKQDLFLREKAEHLQKLAGSASMGSMCRHSRSFNEWLREYELIASDHSLRVKLVGELLVVVEPVINFNTVERLGRLGVQVEQTINFSSWVYKNLFLNLLHIRWQKSDQALVKPYLSRFIGGHGLESIAHTIKAAEGNFDGVVQLAPLGCMPELVAMEILQHVAKEKRIPTLSLLFDEHTSATGLMTRLEAFVDLLRSNRSRRAC